MKCVNCGFDNLPEMRFCGQCGTQLGLVCAACSFVNPSNYRFCGQCGTPLAEASALANGFAAPVESFAAEPLEKAAVPARLEPAQLEGERRLATVILADVVDSTGILERMGTEAWVQTMNRVLQIVEAEVYRFGGVVDQFRGDGLVAFFGAESTHEDDPERAVLAGLAMHTALKPYAAELAAREGISLRLRVGVSTGEVIVASIGDDRHHSEDTAMGEAIALAARMENAAAPGTVLVSENTFRLVASRFEWEPLGQISAKGVSQPVPVFRPLNPQVGTARMPRFHVHDLSALLIGREAEFDILNAEIDGLRAGRGGIVIISGETGMGKSLLLTSARQHAARDDALLAKVGGIESLVQTMPSGSLTWLVGRCRSYAQSLPYSMWLDLLGTWLHMREGEPPAETRERLQRQAQMLWGEFWAEHYPYLASLLSLPLENAAVQRMSNLDAQGWRQQLFLAVRSWLEAIARQGPLVLALEDMHWADTTSLELLEYCLPLCDHDPLLWLIVYRPDRTSAVWDFRHCVETEYSHRVNSLSLSPLTPAQGEKVIDRLIGPEALSPETRALLLERAEGNPYYIEEFIEALIREGVLERDEQTGHWRATREVDSLDLPGSLQNLLLARIDRLPPEERRVLHMAAVIGSVFWSGVLQALMYDGAEADARVLNERLNALQRAQLIHERGQVAGLGMECEFESNLIRDAAYERLLSVQRVTYHRKVADTLEQIFGEKLLSRYYSLLAYHYRRASAKRKELFYTLLAAEEAREVYSNVEALEHYARALQLLDQIEAQTAGERQLYAIRTQRFEVLNGRREIFFLAGDYEAGWADAQALLPLARQLEDDPVWLLDALLRQPGVGYIRSKEEATSGVPLAEQALQLARQIGDKRREMHCLGAIAGQRYYLSDSSWQELAERALDMARELGDKKQEAEILMAVGGVYAVSDPERSQEYLETALPIIRDMDDMMAELELLRVIGVQLESSGDYYRRLKECHEKQLQISREIGHRPIEAQALMFCGQIQGLYLGDYDAGTALLEESHRIWEATPSALFPLLRIAQIRVEQGRHDEALEIMERISAIDERDVTDLGRVGTRLVSAILFNSLGDEQRLRKALELTAGTHSMSFENPQLSQQYQMVAACEAANAHLGLARIISDEAERGHHLRLALESSNLALQLYQSFGFVRPIECLSEEILYRHSLALAANGDESQAAEFLERAHDEMTRKYNLIPVDCHFRRTYLENISLHRDIRAALPSGLSE